MSAVVSNGSVHYDHDKDGTHSELAGCEAQFRNKDYETFVMIRYENNKLSGQLCVRLSGCPFLFVTDFVFFFLFLCAFL